ncbi:MAG: riboflavin biosynthesis protein RibF [Lactobacillaceae bacterium]|jgi:riboflavin kinase/FMN adenylyltransferase|nr:riboflavin biosynthesis protein RibF [Lactobacillaceae bacterium]
MKVIHLHHPYEKTAIEHKPIVLAMGFFDGVHAGHRAVIAQAKKIADEQGISLAVLTYNQHASIVFKKHDNPIQYLTTLERKLEIFAQLGVEQTYVVDFTSALAKLSPADFVEQYMLGLGAVAVVAGFDHTFGPKDTANMHTLPDLAAGRFEVIEVPPVQYNGEKSASTQARQLLADGQIKELNELLVTSYETSGVIVHGEARGREMGFPTLNIETPIDERIPGGGVYVAEVQIADQWYPGMGQIGYNVTFGDGRPQTVEINLFDFNDEVYGEHVRVRWYAYLRGEVKFTGMEPLIEQLQLDETNARQFFKNK